MASRYLLFLQEQVKDIIIKLYRVPILPVPCACGTGKLRTWSSTVCLWYGHNGDMVKFDEDVFYLNTFLFDLLNVFNVPT